MGSASDSPWCTHPKGLVLSAVSLVSGSSLLVSVASRWPYQPDYLDSVMIEVAHIFCLCRIM